MKLFVSERANRDLLSIYSYIWQRNPTAADALLQRIDEKFQQLSQLPFIGRERSSLAPGLRSAIVGMHLIFYVVEPDSITIIRVIDGRMDIDAEFRR